MESGLIELRACLASLEQMIERARLLTDEYDRRIRQQNYQGPPVAQLEHAISFPEVRSLDLLCKDTLERVLPSHPSLATEWYVHDDVGIAGPEDLHTDLVRKRSQLQHAINLVEAQATLTPSELRSAPSVLPREYQKLADSVQLFFADTRRDCQDYDRNVFIMTRFEVGNATLKALDETVRTTLQAHDLVGHRADDRCYPNDRNLWDNVCTYMLCCKYGIAVLEDMIADEFNPNVALEYGFMRALGKPTLLLKERRFKPRADILGTIWHEFDMLDVPRTVADSVDRWIDDLGV